MSTFIWEDNYERHEAEKYSKAKKKIKYKCYLKCSCYFFFTEEVKEKAVDLSCQNSPISFSPGCKCLLLLRTLRENAIGGLWGTSLTGIG